jgi:ABC-2 type transport system permease protein
MAVDSPTLEKYLHATGQGGIVDSFFATMLLILALLTGTFAVSSALRLYAEEASGRLEPLLATGLSRARWYAGSLAVTGAAAVGLLFIAGFGLGLTYGISVSDGWQPFRMGLLELVFAPAVLVLAALVALLTGWAPGWVKVAWAFTAFCLVLGWLGGLLDAPRWVVTLSPYTHTPSVPTQPVTLAAPVVTVLAAAVLCVAGLTGLRRRDIESG